jgi:hypothetical protein
VDTEGARFARDVGRNGCDGGKCRIGPNAASPFAPLLQVGDRRGNEGPCVRNELFRRSSSGGYVVSVAGHVPGEVVVSNTSQARRTWPENSER